ncbi:snRNA-activating protein complex subunit 2 [Protopterus annectens]|uniref:snRNA-activating protein complex subunit 2 n=1 Tax=Protopterus annectens TaxID=7888 RepID=UPI001CFB8C11|nr:snRNA-activating protein complex subunit 2 [Protopterus annectens]
MKPPERRRSAPSRYIFQSAQKKQQHRYVRYSQWSAKEKHILLRGLKSQTGVKELNIEQLKQYLPRKTEAEVAAFIHQLKGRVAREAARKEYVRLLEEKRKREAKAPAPIEVWIKLAADATGKLEEAMTVAFSQMLTIAATEPVSLRHSVPSKPTKVTEKKVVQEEVSGTQEKETSSTQPSAVTAISQTPDAPIQGAGEQTSNPSSEASMKQHSEVEVSEKSAGVDKEDSEFTVDFEKIYHYFSALARGIKLPTLSSFESAVLFDLLMSLPEELPKLDCYGLQCQTHQAYSKLTTPQNLCGTPDQDSGPCRSSHQAQDVAPLTGMEDCSKGNAAEEDKTQRLTHIGQDTSRKLPKTVQMSLSSPVTSAQTLSDHASSQQNLQSGTQHLTGHKNISWKDVDVCPLNPFMLPLKLLARGTTEADL